MPSTGYLQLFAYSSKARLPLKDVAVTISDSNNKIIAMGLTDRNGKFGPLAISVPDRSDSLSPGSTELPFSTVNVHARLENYEQIEADDIQLFANTLTTQDLEMIPLAELPDQWTKSEFFITQPQNL